MVFYASLSPVATLGLRVYFPFLGVQVGPFIGLCFSLSDPGFSSYRGYLSPEQYFPFSGCSGGTVYWILVQFIGPWFVLL